NLRPRAHIARAGGDCPRPRWLRVDPPLCGVRGARPSGITSALRYRGGPRCTGSGASPCRARGLGTRITSMLRRRVRLARLQPGLPRVRDHPQGHRRLHSNMAKKRVHELAKQYDMPSAEVMKKLNDYGLKVKASASAVDEDEAERALTGKP